MKSILALVVAVAFPILGNAATPDCKAEVLKIANMNLGYVSQSLGWGAQFYVSNPRLIRSYKVKLLPRVFVDRYDYSVDGGIYKGDYRIKVTVEGSACTLVASSLNAVAN